MNLRSVSTAVLLAALFVPAFAQSSPEEEEPNLTMTLPTDEWYVPKNTITFGYRVLGSGIKANFGHLGNITMRTNIAPTTTGESRTYDNGAVTFDGQRTIETITTPPSVPNSGDSGSYAVIGNNGRYQTYLVTNTNGTISTVQTGDYLTNQTGETRVWRYLTDSQAQLRSGYIGLSNYGTSSDGAMASKDEGVNGGIELTLSRALGQPGRRFQWGLTAGLALNNMTAKTGGTIHATLNTSTDFYALNGPVPTTELSGGGKGGPTFDTFTNSAGTQFGNSLETTTTLDVTPDAALHTTSSLAGGATVAGNWKIKGAYMLMRVGPSIRTQLSERFGVSASIGLAGAYAGSRYSVVETLELTDVIEPVSETIDSVENKFLGGFYADLNVDWVANERTGLFAGVNVQNLGSYDQEVGGRTAKIDFGSAVGIRGGMSIKF